MQTTYTRWQFMMIIPECLSTILSVCPQRCIHAYCCGCHGDIPGQYNTSSAEPFIPHAHYVTPSYINPLCCMGPNSGEMKCHNYDVTCYWPWSNWQIKWLNCNKDHHFLSPLHALWQQIMRLIRKLYQMLYWYSPMCAIWIKP